MVTLFLPGGGTGPTTNLMRNTGGEQGVFFWAVTSGLTLADANPYISVTAPAGSAGKRLTQTSAILTLTGEARPYASAITVKGTGQVEVETTIEYTDASAVGAGRSSTFTLSATETRIFAPIAVANPAKTINLVRISVWWVTDTGSLQAYKAQTEQKAVSTPFVLVTRSNRQSLEILRVGR